MKKILLGLLLCLGLTASVYSAPYWSAPLSSTGKTTATVSGAFQVYDTTSTATPSFQVVGGTITKISQANFGNVSMTSSTIANTAYVDVQNSFLKPNVFNDYIYVSSISFMDGSVINSNTNGLTLNSTNTFTAPNTFSNKVYISSIQFADGSISTTAAGGSVDVTNRVPYTGASSDLNMGAHSVTATTFIGTASYVNNGVYTYGSYANPAWITTLAGSKITGSVALAVNAGNATTANSATLAVNATTAAYAVISGTSNYSNTSGTSTYSINSGTAAYCTTAINALYADMASTATYVITTSTANYAINAGTANYTTSTGYAYTAGNSATSDYATNAGYAIATGDCDYLNGEPASYYAVDSEVGKLASNNVWLDINSFNTVEICDIVGSPEYGNSHLICNKILPVGEEVSMIIGDSAGTNKLYLYGSDNGDSGVYINNIKISPLAITASTTSLQNQIDNISVSSSSFQSYFADKEQVRLSTASIWTELNTVKISTLSLSTVLSTTNTWSAKQIYSTSVFINEIIYLDGSKSTSAYVAGQAIAAYATLAGNSELFDGYNYTDFARYIATQTFSGTNIFTSTSPLQITYGAQNNYVLTSNAEGKASWQSVSSQSVTELLTTKNTWTDNQTLNTFTLFNSSIYVVGKSTFNDTAYFNKGVDATTATITNIYGVLTGSLNGTASTATYLSGYTGSYYAIKNDVIISTSDLQSQINSIVLSSMSILNTTNTFTAPNTFNNKVYISSIQFLDGSISTTATGGALGLLTADNTWDGSNTFSQTLTATKGVSASTAQFSGNVKAFSFIGDLTGTATNATSAGYASYSGYTIGNAASVTNGVYSNGVYSNPSWIDSLAGTKISGSVANADNATNANYATNATYLGGAPYNADYFAQKTTYNNFTTTNTFTKIFVSTIVWADGSISTTATSGGSSPGGVTVTSLTVTDSYTFNIGEVYVSSTIYPFFYGQYFCNEKEIIVQSVNYYASYLSTIGALGVCRFDVVCSTTQTSAETRYWYSLFTATTAAASLVVGTTTYNGANIVPDYATVIPANSQIAVIVYNAPPTGIAPTFKIRMKYTRISND